MLDNWIDVYRFISMCMAIQSAQFSIVLLLLLLLLFTMPQWNAAIGASLRSFVRLSLGSNEILIAIRDAISAKCDWNQWRWMRLHLDSGQMKLNRMMENANKLHTRQMISNQRAREHEFLHFVQCKDNRIMHNSIRRSSQCSCASIEVFMRDAHVHVQKIPARKRNSKNVKNRTASKDDWVCVCVCVCVFSSSFWFFVFPFSLLFSRTFAHVCLS